MDTAMLLLTRLTAARVTTSPCLRESISADSSICSAPDTSASLGPVWQPAPPPQVDGPVRRSGAMTAMRVLTSWWWCSCLWAT